MRFSSRFWTVVSVLCIVAAVFVAYANALGNGFVSWDDYMLVLFNPAVNSHMPETWHLPFTTYDPELYIPLTLLSFRLEHWLFGFNPLAFHIDNILIHAINALLVMALAWHWSGKRLVGVLAGLLFAVHPIFTEAVVWISARKDVLSVLFFLATLLSFALYKDRQQRIFYIVSLLLYVLAPASKVFVATLPLVLILQEFLKRRPLHRTLTYELAPFFAISGVFGIVGILGKTGRLGELTGWPILLVWGKTTALYFTRFLFPFRFSIIAGLFSPLPLITFGNILVTFALIGVMGVAIAFRERWRVLSFGLLFLFITSAPNLFTLARGEWISVGQEKYCYLPFIGLIFIMSVGIVAFLQKRNAFVVRSAVVACIVVLLISWTATIRERSLTWRNDQALFTAATISDPSIADPYLYLGMTEFREGNLIHARETLERGLAVEPTNGVARAAYGQILLAQGEIDRAEQEIAKALVTASHHATVHSIYGMQKIAQGDMEAAMDAFETAQSIFPTRDVQWMMQRVRMNRR